VEGQLAVAASQVDAVERQGMGVGVESERGVEALDEGHRPGVGEGDGAEAELVLGAPTVATLHLLDEGAHHRGAQRAVVTDGHPQRPGQRADPLPERHLGQHTLAQVAGRIGHAPAEARRTEAALLAGKGHQPLEPTRRTPEAQQAMLENAAAQVGLHLPMHEARQRPALRLGLLDEGRPVLGHHLVEHRPLGAPPLVRGRARTMMMRRRRSCVSRRHGDSAIAMVVPPPKCPTSHARANVRAGGRHGGGWRPPPSARPPEGTPSRQRRSAASPVSGDPPGRRRRAPASPRSPGPCGGSMPTAELGAAAAREGGRRSRAARPRAST